MIGSGDFLLRIPALLLAITFHEFAHGYAAYRLGDPTAKNYGRLSLNPIKHLDPLGTIALLFIGFGWAKPVPINPIYFKDQKKGTALVGLAGPLANLILAFISLILFKMFFNTIYILDASSDVFLQHMGRNFIIMLNYVLMYNIWLAVFNLIPIPPLDGSKIFISVMPPRIHYNILRYESYGQVILLILLFTGFLTPVLSSVSGFILNILQAIVRILPI